MKYTKNIEKFFSILIIFGIISFVGVESIAHHHHYSISSKSKEYHDNHNNKADADCLICDLLKNYQNYFSDSKLELTEQHYSATQTILILNNIIANCSDKSLSRAPPAII